MNENKKTIDVTALGELLVDFTMNGQSEQGNQIFEACPGGAPCNVLALLQKMGKKTAFIGKVGNDQFGKMLKATIEEAGIDKVFSIIVNKYRNTTNQNKYLDDLKTVLGQTTILLPDPIKELSQIETLLEKGKSVWETNSKGLQEVQDSLIEVIKGM